MSTRKATAALTRVTIPDGRITRMIVLVRGQKILLDRDPAVLYGVDTRTLNQAIRGLMAAPAPLTGGEMGFHTLMPDKIAKGGSRKKMS